MRRPDTTSRLGGAMLLVAIVLASPASAIEMAQVGGPSVVNVGDTFTIELGIANASRDTVQGIEVDLIGLAGTAILTSGQAERYYLSLVCLNSDTCFGGVEWVKCCPYYRDLAARYTPGDASFELIRALGLAPTTADGSIDPGLDGDGSPVDVRITLQAIGLGQLRFVGRYSNGVDVLPFSGFAITIVPEPGPALLVGLGLAGLAVAERRRVRPSPVA